MWPIKNTYCAWIGSKTIFFCILYPKRRPSILLPSAVPMKVCSDFIKYYAWRYMKKCFCLHMCAFSIDWWQRKIGIKYLYFWGLLWRVNGAKYDQCVHDIMCEWTPTFCLQRTITYLNVKKLEQFQKPLFYVFCMRKESLIASIVPVNVCSFFFTYHAYLYMKKCCCPNVCAFFINQCMPSKKWHPTPIFLTVMTCECCQIHPHIYDIMRE